MKDKNNMRKNRILCSCLLLLCALVSCAQQSDENVSKTLQTITDKPVLVVSHRADWRNAPENSLQAIKNCIEMGVDMIEIDLKKTKDGHLILMHDKKIDRTTTGKGLPQDYTLEELRKFRLKNGAGHKTAHPIPTLEEVMNLCKGKILVNVDKGYDYFQEAYQILEKTGTTSQCIIKSDFPYEKVVSEHGDVLQKMTFMPVVNLDNPAAESIIDGYIKNLKPSVFELVFSKDSEETLRLIKKVHDSGAKIFVNVMWPELCGGHDDDKAVEEQKYEQSWGWIIRQNMALIQTDRPRELLEYLKTKKLHD